MRRPGALSPGRFILVTLIPQGRCRFMNSSNENRPMRGARQSSSSQKQPPRATRHEAGRWFDVAHVGVCGTDFHIFEGKHPYLAYPRVMGHEISGTVAAINGPASVSVGQDVIVNPYLSCGQCSACRQGKPNCCVSIQVLGVHRDGAMSEQIHVPVDNLLPADGLSLVEAAAVEFLAVGAHAVRRSMALSGTRALVIGAGPIGLGTALFARIAKQSVTLMDVSSERLAFAAQQLGFLVIDGSKGTDPRAGSRTNSWNGV